MSERAWTWRVGVSTQVLQAWQEVERAPHALHDVDCLDSIFWADDMADALEAAGITEWDQKLDRASMTWEFAFKTSMSPACVLRSLSDFTTGHFMTRALACSDVHAYAR